MYPANYTSFVARLDLQTERCTVTSSHTKTPSSLPQAPQEYPLVDLKSAVTQLKLEAALPRQSKGSVFEHLGITQLAKIFRKKDLRKGLSKY